MYACLLCYSGKAYLLTSLGMNSGSVNALVGMGKWAVNVPKAGRGRLEGKWAFFTTFKSESGLVYHFKEGKWAFLILSRGKCAFLLLLRSKSGLFYYFQEGKWAC